MSNYMFYLVQLFDWAKCILKIELEGSKEISLGFLLQNLRKDKEIEEKLKHEDVKFIFQHKKELYFLNAEKSMQQEIPPEVLKKGSQVNYCISDLVQLVSFKRTEETEPRRNNNSTSIDPQEQTNRYSRRSRSRQNEKQQEEEKQYRNQREANKRRNARLLPVIGAENDVRQEQCENQQRQNYKKNQDKERQAKNRS